MPSFVILFRGINVSGKNIMPMKALVEALNAGGFHHVKTYIQSGNVVVQSAQPPKIEFIKQLVADKFGFVVDLLILSQAEFEQIRVNNPYDSAEGKFVHFYICGQTPTLDINKTQHLLAETESYQLIDSVLYLHAPNGIGRSKLVAKVEACLGVFATGRNLNTINKLHKMLTA